MIKLKKLVYIQYALIDDSIIKDSDPNYNPYPITFIVSFKTESAYSYYGTYISIFNKGSMIMTLFGFTFLVENYTLIGVG